jgi:rhamnosyltransferase
MRIACIVPTYNGESELARLLTSLKDQTVAYDLYVVDSGSLDRTRSVAVEFNASLLTIAKSEFNHGGTRQLMADRCKQYDALVFLTQDAYLERPDALSRIVAPFSDEQVGAVCGRQLPHKDATPIAQHAREFNYPVIVETRCLRDVARLGLKAAFLSNSFAAYRPAALQSVGGFPVHVIFGEDMYVAAKLLLSGWKVAYAGNARCRHSHNYSIREEFERYFDMGVFHAREPWIRQSFGGAGSEGMRFVLSELQFLGFRRVLWWPNAIVRNAAKLAAYKLGQRERVLRRSWKRKLGMLKRYWDGPYADPRT